jgi:hypothetical protein
VAILSLDRFPESTDCSYFFLIFGSTDALSIATISISCI